MTVTVANIEFLAFCLQESPGVGSATLRTILRRMDQERCDADQFLALDDRTLQARFGLKREAVAFVRSPDEKVLETWQALQQKGVTVLVRGQAGYPDRINKVLAETAPPLLYVLGRAELFQTRSVGFCGSRKASDKGLKVAEDCSRLLAREHINVISGYAHGVDLAAHKGALEAGGTTTIVLAEGILHFRTKEQLQGALGDDPLAHALIVSEFPPRLPWKAHNAMTRNRTICGLSDAMVVIESGLEGGTFEAGKTTLALKVPLFCVEYAEPVPSAAGNAYFLQHGAIGLKRARNGQPNLSKLFSILRDPTGASGSVDTVEPQLTLHEDPPSYIAPALQPHPGKMTTYPKRLIEVDLPIKRISAHARREKSIRHGHISTLHIWWARRPLAACRAVICAALWPDPADADCPPAFREAAAKIILDFARKVTNDTKLANDHCSPENYKVWSRLVAQPSTLNSQPTELRRALLDFIADFANWDNSTVREYLDTSRALTAVAHNALINRDFKLPPEGPDFLSTLNHQLSTLPRPLVVDPFCGGGSIPLEALRVGADAFGSDLNPIPVLLNKVVLEYIPKYGQRLADEVRKWGEWIKREAEKELAEFYPKDADGATPIAYLWARTIQCEGPGCGAEVPLITALWLAKRSKNAIALRLVPNQKTKSVGIEIVENAKSSEVGEGTIRRSSVACPVCGFTTPTASLRRQMKERKGATHLARLTCIVSHTPGQQGRSFRLPTKMDHEAVRRARELLGKRKCDHKDFLSLVPDEPVNPLPHSVNRLPLYGMRTWGDVFTERQALALTTFVRLVKEVGEKLARDKDSDFAEATTACLALTVDRVADRCSSLCRYDPSPTMSGINNTFARQALPMVWDFGEGDPNSERSGGWGQCLGWLLGVLEHEAGIAVHAGTAAQASATKHPLPDDSANAFISDPPYFDMICYADLSDFFYVWLRRALAHGSVEQWKLPTTPKAEEIIVEPTHVETIGVKDEGFYLNRMTSALREGRRVVRPDGISVIVFAHKSTSGWESLLQALMDAGWIITGSWPIDTEMANKVAGIGQARLASSVHLVCRPRENPDGLVRTDEIGDWRDVLQELPRRIHEWMPRLAEEGVVGADAIFACLGPALEIFSRYSRVEKASGDIVTLKEYLESVWAAVAKEALTIIFPDADTSAFEEDARLTAMWLWTLQAGDSTAENAEVAEEEQSGDDSIANRKSKIANPKGFVLEYDAARKIAQGLGAHLEDLSSLVEVSGDQARLLPVGERARHLFGKEEGKGASRTGLLAKKKKVPQLDLFKVLEQADEGGTTSGETKVDSHGETVLDRIHQSMILFAAGRSEAIKRFLVEDGAGHDPRFWRLAQALSALYPSHTEEKRWVDGVLARKKGLGF